MIHIKRFIIGLIVVFVILFIGLSASFLFYSTTSEAPPDLLTTNIDFKNKTIGGSTESIDTTSINESFRMSILADFFQSVLEKLSSLSIYQGMASLIPGVPHLEYIKISAGERKEQIADRLSHQFKWSKQEKEVFLNANLPISVTNDGYYYPGFYTIKSTASSSAVRDLVFNKFYKNVVDRYATSTSREIELNTALTVASIIQRESGGDEDKAYISGILWNRIFTGMNLQVDATLQYSKGTTGNWWPKVKSKDKYIPSPFNTYRNSGLPPSPISNVSLASLEAALNPIKTNCIFYLHDNLHNFHCSPTYQGHLDNIKIFLK